MSKLATDSPYPRDFIGYGPTPPDPAWPNGAKVALSFVLNYEEGGENTVLNGDAGSEIYLHEVPGGTPRLGARNETVESQFGYGARAGAWRVLRLFEERGLPLTVYGVGRALELNPPIARAFIEKGHEVACHGWRWIDYAEVDEATEREHIAKTIAAVTELCGVRPVGWYTGRISARTRALVQEAGGFLYDSDSYEDDLPFYVPVGGGTQLVIPYTLDANDMKFGVAPGFASSDAFAAYLRDGLDLLRGEGGRMMSVGLHARMVGRPGRAAALARFLDHVVACQDVWVCRRMDIARHWRERFPPE
ncbi:putative urate catabolism protein [Humitalea rosea]|uniref:Chitooligosaccharide deacetylase n=1 Tax=Humitalea rosea TaxID=990373 RepID=A0A2W7ISY2_9PROT|nr:allantoinase PuuE [Humitalea rosea]PZW50956.1 putative urate catabolism protein [Humitalea rosea]